MNISVSNPTINGNWKRFKTQYLAAACGVALAAVGVASIGTIRSNDGVSTGPAVAAAPAGIKVAPSYDARQTFLIVGSVAERDSLVRVFDADSHNWAPGVEYHVLVATDDAQAVSFFEELQSTDPNRVVSDLRVAPAVAAAAEAQADSTERAALVTAQEQFMVAQMAPPSSSNLTTAERIAEIMRRPSPPSKHLMFVVGTHAEAEVLRRAIFEHSQYLDDSATREVVVVDSDYTRANLEQAVNEMTENGIAVTVYGY